MCTVTAIFNKKEFILTSNRDIQVDRKHSLPPKTICYNGIDIISPIDPEGNGTWIGASSKYIACLLNNLGEEKRDITSRGLLVNKVLSEEISLNSLSNETKKYNPYVLLIFDRSQRDFWEMTWDGYKYQERSLKLENKIWLSSTIYSKNEVLRKRELFLSVHPSFKSKEDVLDFHIKKNNLKKTNIKTTSVTQIYEGSNIELNYRDLILKKNYKLKFSK
tara:strand:- start:209 stop:865 length:657 start_codon:yes stop_codon:yes gene_type:complete